MNRKGMLAALVAGVIGAGVSSTAHADPRGAWLTEGGKSRVVIEQCGHKLCGKIAWLKEPLDKDGTPKLDKNNEDETLRSRPITGLKMLHGFSDDGDGRWRGGRIYNPEDGYTYRSKMDLVDPNTLKVSGCVLFVLCKAQTWTRAE